MAGEIFNPEPQDIKPDNYIGWSRPITEPKANVSSEIALKGAGQAIKGGVELGVGLEENTIRNDIYNKVDTLNDNYIQRLSQADSLIGGQQGDIDQPPKGGTPGLKKLPDALGTLTAARDNGKMSETYYYQQIYNMAKQMRSQNPMFRDYIDNQFSRITKEQPANDMIKSLTQDINAYASNARESRNKVETTITSALKEGLLGPQGGSILAGYQSGQLQAEPIMNMIARASARKYNDEVTKVELSNKKDSFELNNELGAAKIAPMINNKIQTYIDTATIPVGGNLENFRQVFQDIQTGKIKTTPEQNTTLARAAVAQRADIYQRMWKEINDTDQQGHSIMANVYGGNEVKAKAALALAMQPMDDLVDMYGKGDLSLAKMTEVNIKDIENGAQEKWYNHSMLGQTVQMTKGLSMIAGNSPAFIQWTTQIQPPANLAKEMKGLFTNEVMSMATQSTGDTRAPNPGDAIRVGTPITLMDSIEKAKDSGYTGPSAAPMYKGWIDSLALGVANKKLPIPVRVNIAAGLYGPKNDALMSQFKPDSIGDRGQRVPGSTSAFVNLVNNRVADSVSLLGDTLYNQSWDDYKNTAQKWFADTNQQNLETLNRVSDLIKDNKSDIKLNWDSDQSRWNVTLGPYKGTSGEYVNRRTYDENYYNEAKMAVDNLNRGIEGLKSITKKDSSFNVNDYLVKLMTDMQGTRQGLSGFLVQKLKDSLIKSFKTEGTGT